MNIKNTRRGFTQNNWVGQTLPDNAPTKGHLATCIPPHPVSGYPLLQGARDTTHGFTLIELLVVVLIIGILAAVAVPQYQKAVEKSRLATLLAVIKPLSDAQEIYYLEHGKYTTKLEDLSLDFPSNIKISMPNGIIYVANNRFQIEWALKHNTGWVAPAGSVLCSAISTDSLGTKVCENFGGKNKFTDGCGLITGKNEICYKYYLPFYLYQHTQKAAPYQGPLFIT